MDINYNSSYKEVGDSLMITLDKIKKNGETPQLKSEMLFKYARIKFFDKDYDKAYELLGQSNSITLLENLPENKEIYYWCGRVLEAQGKIETAKKNYEMVLKRARLLDDQRFVDEILDRIFLISTNEKEIKINKDVRTQNEKISSCIEISNAFRGKMATKIYEEFIIDKKINLSFNELFKNTFINFWFDKDWQTSTNIFFKILAILFRIIYFPIFLIIFCINRFTKKLRCKRFNEKVNRKLLLQYDNKNYNNFISLWNDKGLNIESDEYTFYENTVIECIISWYNVFFADNKAQVVSSEITRNFQTIHKNAYDSGIRGLRMQSISSQLLEQLNFNFNN